MTSWLPEPVEDQAIQHGAPPKKELDSLRAYVLVHVSDTAVLRDLRSRVSRERTATAEVLAYIAEADARKLYLPAGFPSMHAYCVSELHFSEDAAYKRLQAARKARQFPAIFTALAEGRLHLTGLGLLAPHLTAENADELLSAAALKTKAEIEQLLAQRFPRTEMLALVQAVPASPTQPSESLAPAQVRDQADVPELAPAQVVAPAQRPMLTPLSAESYALQFTIGRATHENLRHVQALLSHQLPSGDIAQVFDLALKALKGQLEKRKFAATTEPRPRSRRSSTNTRHIPAQVKRAVWERDQGQCAFKSETGQRCQSRKFIEYDHVDPVARGGEATVAGVRLLCRAHNQYAAERTFGAGFMSAKREEARQAATEARTRAAAAAEARACAAEAEERSRAVAKEHSRDVMTCLRELGYRAGEARRAVEYCETIPDATLEERVRAALRFLCPKPRFHGRVGASLEART